MLGRGDRGQGFDEDLSSASGTSGETPHHHRRQLQPSWCPFTKYMEGLVERWVVNWWAGIRAMSSRRGVVPSTPAARACVWVS